MKSDSASHHLLPVAEAMPAGKHGSRQTKRRSWWSSGIVTALLVLFFVSLSDPHPLKHCLGRIWEGLHGRRTIEQRVQHILTHHPLLDGHDDLPWAIRMSYHNHIGNPDFLSKFRTGKLEGHVDLARLRQGLSGGAFWSVYAPCPAKGSNFSDANYAVSVRQTMQQIDVMKRLAALHPDDFQLPSSSVNSRSALRAFRHHHKLISPLGIEGLHQIGNSPATLRQFHALGVRYATLTHNCHNRFADAALLEAPLRVAEPRWHGVSDEGRRLVREMNRVGIIVDLAHVSPDTMMDVLGGRRRGDWEGSRAPVIFSHSSAHALCPHPRNVPDDVLRLVKETNSVVMINFSPQFLSCTAAPPGSKDGLPEDFPPNATLSRAVDHILYIGNLIGFDHVGLGSDFDGLDELPEGLGDISKFPDLVAEMLRRDVSDADAIKVVGGNALRVWGDVERVAKEMQASGEPAMEDWLEPLDTAAWLKAGSL